MTNHDPNSAPGNQQQDESLSATGMFLRAFDKPAAEQSGEKEAPGTAAPSSWNEDKSAGVQHPPAARDLPKSSGGGGEFTQMFQTLGSRPSPAEPEAAKPNSPAPLPRPSAPAESAPGEFTRIFSSGGSAAAGGSTQRSGASPAPSSRSKGFSTPGVSESASAGGSFTQFFKAAPSTPKASQPVAAEPVMSESAWKAEPAFKPAEKQPGADAPSGSVTSILSSLASPSTGTSAPRETEPVAYRPSTGNAPPAASSAPAASGGDAGGVTRLIKRLAQEPTAAPPPAPVAPVIVPGQEPSEFTRMISKIGGGASPQPLADHAEPMVAAPAAGPAVSVQVQAPQVPQVPPVAPIAPVGTPKVSAQVSVAHPQPPVIPQAPKIAPPQPPALAIAPPKSKLEAMVPMLLVINTFLLLIVLVVLIFLIKAK